MPLIMIGGGSVNFRIQPSPFVTRTKGRVIMVMLHLHPTVNDRLSWPSIYVIGCIPPLQKYFMLMMINLVVGRLLPMHWSACKSLMHSHNRLLSCKRTLQPNSNFRALARETSGLICSILPFSNIGHPLVLFLFNTLLCPTSA